MKTIPNLEKLKNNNNMNFKDEFIRLPDLNKKFENLSKKNQEI